MRSLRIALQLLTRVPVYLDPAPSPAELAAASRWFSLVGVFVGGVAALSAHLLCRLGRPGLGPWAVVLIGLLLTGGLHEDGLADAADGILGGGSRQRRLEIMRDSRLGSYGVLALIAALGLAVAALATLPPPLLVRAPIVAHALGRALILPLTWLPYARAEGGMATPLVRRVPLSALGTALAIAAASLVLLPLSLAGSVLGVAVAVTVLSGRRFLRDLGGITGDCLGATVKLVEVATYLVVAIGSA